MANGFEQRFSALCADGFRSYRITFDGHVVFHARVQGDRFTTDPQSYPSIWNIIRFGLAIQRTNRPGH